ncbi:MAG: hypothetical protein OXH01_06815 [Bacteroidetes bacterium]|nr:hypothetical protein [Bacteroidota bacterium]
MTDASKECNVWQISAGPSSRSYAKQFLDYGVALIGPGDGGPWRRESCDNKFLSRFASEVQKGDVFLLRAGASEIQAVGIVASGYKYLSQFDDVNGWDLQHGRRVRWCKFPDTQVFDELIFGANPPRLSRVHSEDLIDYANRFVQSPPTDWQICTLPCLPVGEPALETPPRELRGLIAQINDLISVYGDIDSFGELPSESEMVAHYIVPFLRALGWPVERIAVEWHNVDVCVFTKLPRIPQFCHYLIEAKRVGAGVEGALEQAVRYAQTLNSHCNVIVSDGIRYRMYEASKDYAPVAYANLGRLKESSVELFKLMKKP